MIPDYYNPQALNRYAYCYNNPLKYEDPDGHNPGLALLIGGGLALGAFAGGIGYGADYALVQYYETGRINPILFGGATIEGAAKGGLAAGAIVGGIAVGGYAYSLGVSVEGAAVIGGVVSGAPYSAVIFFDELDNNYQSSQNMSETLFNMNYSAIFNPIIEEASCSLIGTQVPEYAGLASNYLEKEYMDNHGEQFGKGYEYFSNNPSHVVAQFNKNLKNDIEYDKKNNRQVTKSLT